MTTLTWLYPSAGQPARKTHKVIRTGAGERLETVGYGRAREYRHETVPVADIESLYAALAERQARNGFAVLGAVRPGAGGLIYRRTHGDHADLIEVETAALAIDLDAEAAPADVDTTDILAVGEYLRARLPLELQDGSCVVQLTAGYGLSRWKPGPFVLRARLWFMLATPRRPSEVRRWMRAMNAVGTWATMDPAVASAAQPIYTAAPVFEGTADPVPQRLALLLGSDDAVEVTPPAAPELPTVRPESCAADTGPLLARLVNRIRRAADAGAARHPEILRVARLAGGYIAGGALDDATATAALVRAGVATGSAGAARAVLDGIALGKREPLYLSADEEDVTSPLPEEPKPADMGAWCAWLARCPAPLKRRAVARFIARQAWRAPWRTSWEELHAAVCSVAAEHADFARWLLDKRHREAAARVPHVDGAAVLNAGIGYHRHRSIDAIHDAIAADGDAVHLVRAPHGTGKTERILRPVALAAGRPAAVTNRVSLVSDLAHRLELTHYQKVKPREVPFLTNLAVCLPSVINPKYAPFLGAADALLIDEVHAVLGEVYAPSGLLKRRAPAVEAALAALMTQCQRVVAVDAGLDTADCLRIAELAAGRPVVVHELLADHATASATWTERSSVEAAVLAAARAGETMRVVCDSAAEVLRIEAMIRAAAPGLRVLAIHSDKGVATTGSAEALAFLADCNGEAGNWDVLVHSPSVESGVSLTTPRFLRTFGFFSGASVAPENFLQMLRRDRTARHFLVCVTGPGVASLPGDEAQVLQSLEASARHSATLAAEERGSTVYIEAATDHDWHVCAWTARANQRKNLAAQSLWYCLEAAGFSCARDYGAPADTRAERLAADEAVEADYRDAVLSAARLTADERAEVDSEYQPDPALAAAIERYDACATLRIDADDLDGTSLALYARGDLRGWLESYKLLRGRVSIEDEAADAAAPMAHRRFPMATAEALRHVCELLEIDPDTGRGSFDAAMVEAAYRALEASPCRAVLETRGYARWSKSPPRDWVKWAAGIFRRCGLALTPTGNTGRCYQIERDRRTDRVGRVSSAGWDAMEAVADRDACIKDIGPHLLPAELMEAA